MLLESFSDDKTTYRVALRKNLSIEKGETVLFDEIE
jgi:hypothetical protein